MAARGGRSHRDGVFIIKPRVNAELEVATDRGSIAGAVGDTAAAGIVLESRLLVGDIVDVE